MNLGTSILVLLGSLFIFIAAFGLLRFKDLYSKMHATTKATSFGLFMLILGIALFFNASIIWVKSLLVILFIYLTAPLAAHSIGKSYRDYDEKSG